MTDSSEPKFDIGVNKRRIFSQDGNYKDEILCGKKLNNYNSDGNRWRMEFCRKKHNCKYGVLDKPKTYTRTRKRKLDGSTYTSVYQRYCKLQPKDHKDKSTDKQAISSEPPTPVSVSSFRSGEVRTPVGDESRPPSPPMLFDDNNGEISDSEPVNFGGDGMLSDELYSALQQVDDENDNDKMTQEQKDNAFVDSVLK